LTQKRGHVEGKRGKDESVLEKWTVGMRKKEEALMKKWVMRAAVG
jgi:hypothetical protein